MSGYFARLLARVQQPASRVQPQAALPFAAPRHLDDLVELEIVDDRTATEVGDIAMRAGTAEHEQTLAPPSPRRERRTATPRPTSDARVEQSDDARSTAPVQGEARPAESSTGMEEQRVSVAPNVRALRDGPASPAARSSVWTDDAPSPRRDADFRLLPETPAVPPVRDGTASGGIDGRAFARATEEARAQIRRQLDAAQTTPSEVHVTIGRIEVTAAPMAPTPPRKAPERVPAVSLEQYLASRARRGP